MQQQHEGRRRRPPRPRASVPAFGGWDLQGAGGAQQAAPPDYSLDFTNIRAARMQRRARALSWSSFVANGTVEAEEASPSSPVEDGKPGHRRWSSAASDGDDDHDRRRRGADDDRQPIRPGRAAPKGRGNFKGYLFGCVGGSW
ncbi:hypothetical protein BS78_05G199500 [Paspalum vaginatum]|nr:hypothetical protein BS78_05G199500 [Paspalum vaginatum]